MLTRGLYLLSHEYSRTFLSKKLIISAESFYHFQYKVNGRRASLHCGDEETGEDGNEEGDGQDNAEYDSDEMEDGGLVHKKPRGLSNPWASRGRLKLKISQLPRLYCGKLMRFMIACAANYQAKWQEERHGFRLRRHFKLYSDRGQAYPMTALHVTNSRMFKLSASFHVTVLIHPVRFTLAKTTRNANFA
jgi:hypothetical protein